MESKKSEKTLFGILAEVRNPKELIDIAKTIRDSGYRDYDTYSPFPIHGMDAAMKLRKSKLGWIVLGHGLVGFFGAIAMIYFMSVVDYPLNISGKTLMNVPAWVPVMFELTILLSAFGATFGMFALNGLPKFNHPLINSEKFEKVKDDGFFVCIEATAPQDAAEKVRRLLEKAGYVQI
jgi:hypothetical protein